MTIGKCSACGFTFRDVRTVEQREPQRLILDIERPDDLNTLVVKAPSASIRIRGLLEEGDFEMKPGPIADGFITTVEGVLHRFLEITEYLCREPDIDKSRCEKALKALREAVDGKRKFTLIIEDPEGISAIASKKVRRELLERVNKEKE